MNDNKMQITKNESLSKVDEMFCELKNNKNKSTKKRINNTFVIFNLSNLKKT